MYKYKPKPTKKFKMSLKSLNKLQLQLLYEIIERLANDEVLDKKHKDHKLIGNLSKYRECHITPDLLLIYEKIDEKPLKLLKLINVGSHSKILNM